MPHVILEYPQQQLDEGQIDTILQALHHAIAGSGLFDASHIKTRAYPFQQYTNAGGADSYMHIQARIKSGRGENDKQQLSAAILDGISRLNLPISVTTVEIIDMDRASYAKHKSAG